MSEEEFILVIPQWMSNEIKMVAKRRGINPTHLLGLYIQSGLKLDDEMNQEMMEHFEGGADA